MQEVKMGVKIEGMTEGNADKIMSLLELTGRNCYKSENKITKNSKNEFIKKIINLGHLSILEHASITARVFCPRGISHQIVRHRIGCSYAQESTRYCNYAKSKFNNEIQVIVDPEIKKNKDVYKNWKKTMEAIESTYFKAIEQGIPPGTARDILPIGTKTEIIMTYTLRAWRHFFKERCSSGAHPQIKYISILLLSEFNNLLPIIFSEDLFPANYKEILEKYK